MGTERIIKISGIRTFKPLMRIESGMSFKSGEIPLVNINEIGITQLSAVVLKDKGNKILPAAGTLILTPDMEVSITSGGEKFILEKGVIMDRTVERDGTGAIQSFKNTGSSREEYMIYNVKNPLRYLILSNGRGQIVGSEARIMKKVLPDDFATQAFAVTFRRVEIQDEGGPGNSGEVASLKAEKRFRDEFYFESKGLPIKVAVHSKSADKFKALKDKMAKVKSFKLTDLEKEDEAVVNSMNEAVNQKRWENVGRLIKSDNLMKNDGVPFFIWVSSTGDYLGIVEKKPVNWPIEGLFVEVSLSDKHQLGLIKIHDINKIFEDEEQPNILTETIKRTIREYNDIKSGLKKFDPK